MVMSWHHIGMSRTNNHEPVTVLFSRTAKPGREQAYERWNEQLIKISERQPGHISTSVVADGDRRYITLQQFASRHDLQAWLDSPVRHERLLELRPLVEDAPEPTALTGMETWFRLPGHAATGHVPRWKMALVTFVVIYFLVLFLSNVLLPQVQGWPLLARNAVLPLVMVPLMTYVVMPRVTRLLRRWLYA